VTGSSSTAQATTGVTAGPGPASSSTGSGGVCDGTGDCQLCGNCAISGQCSPQMNTCQSTQDCFDFMDCMQVCQPNDDVCLSGCANQHATGYKLYTELMVCVVCDSCYGDCDGASSPCQ
jgi:hypothetical protein